MNKYLEKAYAASPLWLQQLGINAYGLFWSRRRLGREFEKFVSQYLERESWPKGRLLDHVNEQFRSQVQRAFREVAFYRQSFREHGLDDAAVNRLTIEDIGKLPLLEKSLLRADSACILTAAAARHRPAAFSTSGTTGTPIRVFWTPAVHQHNIAVREARSFRWAGVSYRQPRSMIGGRLIVPRAHHKPPFWRYNRWEKQLYLSAFHISAANAPDYVAALNRYQPVTMTGYASGNFFLARLIEELGLPVHSPRAVITGSERLEPHMRQVIERVFQTRAFEEYGSVENCALATECECGRLHVSIDFGFVELLRPDGSRARPGEVGEVVATGFSNPDQIFLRYRTGDLAVWSEQSCRCGRDAFPVLTTVVGRQEDTVITPDGREMVRFHGIFLDLPEIQEGQIIQEDLRHFTVKLVCPKGLTDLTETAVKQRMGTRLGPEIVVSVEPVATIPREANGKYRAVVSRVTRASARAGSAPASVNHQ